MNPIFLSLLALAGSSSASLISMTGGKDGIWSSWGPWSSCTSTCTTDRFRKCNPKQEPGLDLGTLLLLGGLGGLGGSGSSTSSLLPYFLSSGSLDMQSMLVLNTLGGGSSSSSSSLLSLLLSGGLGGAGLGGSDSLTTLLLLSSLSDNSTSSSFNDFLPLFLAGQGALGGMSGNSDGMDPMMTLLLLNSLNSNDTSEMMEMLPLLLSNSDSNELPDLSLMLLLLGMIGNNSASGLDPFLLMQLMGQGRGSTTEPSSGLQCEGISYETKPCDRVDCEINNCLSVWGSWESCSATCGSGITSRMRSCKCRDSNTGLLQCNEPLYEKKTCDTNKECEAQTIGQWGEWSTYSNCESYGSKCYKSKRRTCSIPIGCVGAFEQAIECTCPTTNQCAINPEKRLDCGVPGVTQVACEASGCCFDNTVTGSIWCYYPNSA